MALTYSLLNMEPICCFMSGSNCYFLTCIQIPQVVDKVVWFSHLLKNCLQSLMVLTVKVFGIVNKIEVDVFPQSSCFLHDPLDVGNVIFGPFAFSESSLKISIQILLKPHLENFEHCFASDCDDSNFH